MAEVVGKRNAQKQETKLVEVGTEKRDFGQDTLQAALGLLGSAHQPTADYGLQLDERDCICIVRALDQLARKCRGNADFEQAVSSAPYGYRIKAHVNCHSPVALARDYPSVAAGKMKPGTDLAYTMLIRHARTGRRTQLVCSVRCDSNGKCWLNIRANPTSLLAGYNAHGLALEGRNEHSERGIFMRLPFAMLRMIAQSVDPNFKWQDKTASRIAELAFKIGNTQVFTYVKPPISLSDYMSFLQCCYGIPFASPRHNYCSIATALRLKIMSEGHNGLIETLLVRRMAGFVGGDADRGVVSICMYDKAAKARADAAAIDIEVGSAEAMEFLKQHLRVDITMHEAALRKLLAEAGFSEGTEVTARNYRDAIKRLDDGKGKSKQRFSAWLLRYVFDDVLNLRALLEFEPSKLDQATARLRKVDANAAAGFAQWRATHFWFVPTTEKADDKTAGSKTVGKKISFVQFLTKHANKPVKESTARKARAALIEFGLNPDVPLRVYLSFYAQTFSWHMTDAQAVKYAEALESGNKAKVAELQKISRANTLVTVALLRKTYITMMDDASVPAILISKKVETTKAPPSSTSPSVDLRKSKETTPDDDPFA